MTGAHKTIAIIGCGPKGLYAFDCLCRAARNNSDINLDVHIFEPWPTPGAGPVYDPNQPDFLLMNFPTYMINAWTDGSSPSLLEWLKDTGTEVAANTYVPRALVGRYLNWCFHMAVRSAPANLRLKHHPVRVTSLRKQAEIWNISPSDIAVDDVLVTTGHQDFTRDGQDDAVGMIHSPFPIDSALDLFAVPPGATVACKGFALTFIDTMLALSEGRGGAFSRSGQTYSYQPSGHEPAVIAPFSRTGRPMRAKVEANCFAPPQNAGFWAAHIARFETALTTTDCGGFRDHVWPQLLMVAECALETAPGTAMAFFTDWQRSSFDADRCRAELHKGYDIAVGVQQPDIGWAIAEAWRRCYPALVRWVSHRNFFQEDAAFFRTIAAEMERLAFGPPAQNVGKLVCLEEIGLVTFKNLSQPLDADITIDATIPPPGAVALSEPLADLLHEGHVEENALGGICVAADAQALVRGTPTSGLSIIGRTTEGAVLGNDTLSRKLHDLPEKWAARMIRLAAAYQTPQLDRSA